MLNNANPNVVLVSACTLLALILAGLFVLVWHGSITGGEALAVVGGIVAALLSIFGVHTGVQAGARAVSVSTKKLPE